MTLSLFKRGNFAASAVARYARSFSVAAAGIDPSKLTWEKTKNPKTKVAKEKLTFGAVMTDHMLQIDWKKDQGWGAPRVVPYQPLQLDPAASSLHYSLQCFEGMKAYIDSNGDIRMFRPEQNMKRLNRSMARLTLPTFDEEALLDCIKELLKVDKDWIPKEKGYSLYIRPTGISTHPFLGVGPSANAKIYVILCPVGPYYPEGFKPVKLLAETKSVRAWPGGTGNYKIGGNYAPTILPQIEAQKKGYSQVLWLSGPDHLVTEVGTMNMFLLWINEKGEKELITPPLERGDILPGITRQSILELCREWDEFKVSTREFTMEEVAKACEEGRVLEAFGAGTAAIVSPIEIINFQGKDYKFPLEVNGEAGVLTKRINDEIQAIQYGLHPNHPWSVVVKGGPKAKPN